MSYNHVKLVGVLTASNQMAVISECVGTPSGPMPTIYASRRTLESGGFTAATRGVENKPFTENKVTKHHAICYMDSCTFTTTKLNLGYSKHFVYFVNCMANESLNNSSLIFFQLMSNEQLIYLCLVWAVGRGLISDAHSCRVGDKPIPRHAQ